MSIGGKLPRKLVIVDVPIAGKIVLVRVDLDVPIEDGAVSDDAKIRAHLPVIRELIRRNCKVVVVSHREDKGSLEPVAQRLAELLRRQVHFVDQVVGAKVKMAIKRSPDGSIIVLENLFTHAGEARADEHFARQLVADTGANYLVQDSLVLLAQDYASTVVAPRFIPNIAGPNLQTAYRQLAIAVDDPRRPVVVIIGGHESAAALELLTQSVGVIDHAIIAGELGMTMLANRGERMGSTTVAQGLDAKIDALYGTLEQAHGDKASDILTLPLDVGVGTSREKAATRRDVSIKAIEKKMIALDIGPRTVELIKPHLENAGMVIQVGPVGEREIPAFASGTQAVHSILQSRKKPTIEDGGDIALRLMAGQKIPGIDGLLDAPAKTVYTVEKNHKQVLS